jgi:hypothetical protein
MFFQCWLRIVLSYGIKHCVVHWKWMNVSEECIASIFNVKDKPWKKPGWSRQQARLCLLAASCWSLALRIPWHWRWRWHVPLKHQLTFTTLCDFISQKVELFLNKTSACWHYCLNKNCLASKPSKIQSVLLFSDNSLWDTHCPCFSNVTYWWNWRPCTMYC